jgi:uncharacterized membrane-anchored protein
MEAAVTKGHLYLALAVVLGMYLFRNFVQGKYADRSLFLGVTLDNVVEAAVVVLAVVLVHKMLPVSA